MGLRTVRNKIYRIRRKFRDFCWRNWSKVSDRTTLTTKHGQFTVFTADQVIGRHLYLEGEYESAWIAASLKFLRDRDAIPPKGEGTVLDIGANVGIISIGMLRDGEFQRAIGIEPDPNNFALFELNVRQNQLEDRCVCLHAAATDRAGESELELSDVNFGDHRVRIDVPHSPIGREELHCESARRTIRIPADTLDGMVARLPQEFTDDIVLAWIDTQGHEGHIFLGGHELFSRNIPVVCEISPYLLHRAGLSREQFFDIVREHWSHYWVLRGGKTFVSYPTSVMSSLFDELVGDTFDNVILTK